MFVKAFLLDIYYYNININLSKYRRAGNLFNFDFQNLKISIFVSMAIMEAALVLELFQLLIVE